MGQEDETITKTTYTIYREELGSFFNKERIDRCLNSIEIEKPNALAHCELPMAFSSSDSNAKVSVLALSPQLSINEIDLFGDTENSYYISCRFNFRTDYYLKNKIEFYIHFMPVNDYSDAMYERCFEAALTLFTTKDADHHIYGICEI